MATRQGPRFGDEKGVQRNKEEQAGQSRANRSPTQSNAARALPSLKEDVSASQSRDTSRIGRGLSPTGQSALTRAAQQEAAGRAITRTTARAGLAGAALTAGYELGKALDEKTGIGKKVVNAVLGEAKEKGPRVELSAYSKQRLSELKEDNKKETAKEKAPVKKAAVKDVEVKGEGVREGRNENIDEDTRKRAMESVANLAKGGVVKKYASGGMVKANCGASMKPSQSKKY